MKKFTDVRISALGDRRSHNLAQFKALETITSKDGGMYGNTTTYFMERSTGETFECASYHSQGGGTTYDFSNAEPIAWKDIPYMKCLCEQDFRDGQWESLARAIDNEARYISRKFKEVLDSHPETRERQKQHIAARLKSQLKRISDFKTNASFA